MRLAQLARKIGVRSADIVQHLSSATIEIVDDANTKLSDEQVASVIQHFAPGFVLAEQIVEAAPEPVMEEQIVQQAAEVEEEPVSAAEPVVEEEVVPVPALQSEVTSLESMGSDEVELIKAPKVSLSGLKVLGKIELPQPKKKEVKPEGEDTTELAPETSQQPAKAPRSERNIRVERERQHPRKNRNDDRPRKNPVALQREREAQEAEEKRKEELKRTKEKRTQHYQQRVKPSQPVRAMRLYDEPTETEVKQSKAEPTSWFGKFWRWFRS